MKPTEEISQLEAELERLAVEMAATGEWEEDDPAIGEKKSAFNKATEQAAKIRQEIARLLAMN